MKTLDKIKWMNVGVGLSKLANRKTTEKQFYIGLDETADLFIKIIEDMGLGDIIKTEKIDVDGECELRVEVTR